MGAVLSSPVMRNHEKTAEGDGRKRRFKSLPDIERATALLDELNERRAPPKAPVLRMPLVLYGAGEEGIAARRYLSVVGVPIARVMDHEAEGLGENPDWRGIAAGEPGGADGGMGDEALVAVTPTDRPYAPIARKLGGDGWRTVVPFLDLAESCRERQPASGGWCARWQNKKEFARAKTVLEGWADAESRAHHLRFAAWRMRRSEWDFAGAPVSTDDRFMIAEILRVIRHDERLLDVGAHRGDGLLRLAMRPGAQFGHAWAIEPDATSRAILEATIVSHGRDLASKVTVLSHVIGATAGPVPFREGLGCWSQISDTGNDERTVVTIDALDIAPTFMAIDVPGGHAVLEGARQTLERQRPIVAIDVGHDSDGLFKIAEFLMTTLGEYRFLMRCHGWCGVRSVVYAIPNERTPG